MSTTDNRPSTGPQPDHGPPSRRQVVIIGGGFGGLTAAQALRRADVDVVLIDRTNHHLFQPLLYQVATAALSPGDIAWPLRTAFRSQPNVRVVMEEVEWIDRSSRSVRLRDSPPIPFDVLIAAPGARHAYFGHEEWESYAPGLKTLADGVDLCERMLLAFEQAERRRSSTQSQNPLTFVIVGGGPTGVEVAGALSEIGRKAMRPDFPHLQLQDLRILLIEAGERLLPAFAPRLSARARTDLERMGVTVMLNAKVRDVQPAGVVVGEQFIESSQIIWAAGNRASPILDSLKVELDGSGRVKVRPDLTIKGEPWIFVIGDGAHCVGPDGKPLPGLAPVAMQQGRYVGSVIARGLLPEHRRPFAYADRGMLATIGRAKAVAELRALRFAGLIAWLLWCLVHIFFLIGVRNRFRVMSEWIWYYITFKPGARLIYGRPRQHLDRKATGEST
ncbi:MAG TPA: NAD(P)/FAD-dependent oxidoreductase [Nitrospiraceae bacterium]|nr:NAD(P)/FAD-dependent oxidoreductase [Nitrospiraceae bacterium]